MGTDSPQYQDQLA